MQRTVADKRYDPEDKEKEEGGEGTHKRTGEEVVWRSGARDLVLERRVREQIASILKMK